MSKCFVKVTCNTGKTWNTQINCSFEDAQKYFIGTTVTDENEATGQEIRHNIIKCEEIS